MIPVFIELPTKVISDKELKQQEDGLIGEATKVPAIYHLRVDKIIGYYAGFNTTENEKVVSIDVEGDTGVVAYLPLKDFESLLADAFFNFDKLNKKG